MSSMLYLLFLGTLLCLSYVALFYFFPYFFEARLPRRAGLSMRSVGVIVLYMAAAVLVVYLIPDEELANRFQHAFAGGFAVILVCFLAMNDAGVRVSRLRFFIVSFMLMNTLGVANEIFEFFLQTQYGYISATTVIDTWQDLTSNVVGSLIASIVLIPLLKVKR